MLYQVDTGYACGGVIVEEGVVVDAANIFKWMIGKQWNNVRTWRKIQRIRMVE